MRRCSAMVLTGLLLSVTACSNGPADPLATEPAAGGASEATISGAPLTLQPDGAAMVSGAPTSDPTQLFEFGAFAANQLAITAAVEKQQNEAVQRCMSRAGFTFRPPPVADVPPNILSRRYGIPERSEIEEFGYGRSEADFNPDVESNPRSSEPAYINALFGSEPTGEVIELLDTEGNSIGQFSIPGGCLGEAVATIFGSPEAYGEFVRTFAQLENLLSESYTATLASPEMRALETEWADCMVSAGYADFASPFEAQNADWRIESDSPSPLEISTALADRNCRDQVEYARRAFEIESSFQTEKLQQYALLMDSLSASLNSLGIDSDEWS